MKIRPTRFPLGSSYYPPAHDPEDWERDLVAMRAAGLNMIRTAELITSWDYIEPRRGQPEWDWLDRTFELADKHDFDIVLGTGSCKPPIWMLEPYPDLQRISREGVPYPTNTVAGWACVNNPGLRRELRRYLTLLLERYGDMPALYCWQLDNQIGHNSAFTGAEHAQPRRYGYYCYCDHCAEAFRTWLEAKYGDIDALNHAWTWDPTHYRYYGWHQLQPPRSMPAEWGNGTAWLDFRRFVHDSLNDYLQYQHDLIKTFDAEQLTMHNLYDCMRPDLGARKEPNHWDVGGIPDIIGHDIYPSENNYRNDPEHASWFLDFAYSVAHHNDRTMWIPELESGPLGGFSAGTQRAHHRPRHQALQPVLSRARCQMHALPGVPGLEFHPPALGRAGRFSRPSHRALPRRRRGKPGDSRAPGLLARRPARPGPGSPLPLARKCKPHRRAGQRTLSLRGPARPSHRPVAPGATDRVRRSPLCRRPDGRL